MDYAAPSSSTTPPAPVQLNLESIEDIVVAFYRSPQQQAVHQWLLQNQMSMNGENPFKRKDFPLVFI
jgi:hypothetical protein